MIKATLSYGLILTGLLFGCNSSVEDDVLSHKVYMKIEDTLANGRPDQVLYYKRIDRSDSIVGLKRIMYWPNSDIPFYEADYEKAVIIDRNQQGSVTGVNFHNGPYLHWHDNGQLSLSGRHNDGLKEGVWTYWNKEGQIERLRTYKNDSLLNEDIVLSTNEKTE